MKRPRHKSLPPPLDSEALERLAIAYVGRYATTKAKLGRYLERKVKERGWAGPADPGYNAIAHRLAGLGFIDDTAFALARGASYARRGFGERRLRDALRAAGVEEESCAAATEAARDAAWAAATRFAERKGIGPFAQSRADPERRRKQFAMMMRAGHSAGIARALVRSAPGEFPEEDNL